MMKGIVFTGGSGPSRDMCNALAKEAGIIAAADSGLLLAENAGICPNMIIGDMDSLDDTGRLKNYAPETVLRYPRAKDYTDTELALNKLWDAGCDEVLIAGGGGGRTDHLLAIYSLFEREMPPDRWITAAEDMFCLKAGRELKRRIGPEGIVSVFPLGEGPWEAESSSLKWPLKGLEWKRGSFGISNTAETADTRSVDFKSVEFRIRSICGRFLIILPFGESYGSNN
ncbi:MAG: thiamine diphosphokinase [Treponema sp.]|jgi:thiamine pyrophosphokinase|nr:thiamine diphosphokinase [Treponema sp.]